MENKLHKLRSSMEKSVFNDYSFDSQNQRAVQEKLSGEENARRLFPIKPLLSIALFFGLTVVVLGIFGYESGLLPLENRKTGPGQETKDTRNTELVLVDVNVKITSDKEKVGGIGIQSGPKKGQMITPVTLFYEFTIKNTGDTKLGDIVQTDDFSNPKGVAVTIDPSSQLVEAMKEHIGFNVFNPEEYNESGMGHGQQFTPVLTPGQEGEYILSYNLGALEENPEIPTVLSEDQVNNIEKIVHEATLVVTVEEKELARFDLSKSR